MQETNRHSPQEYEININGHRFSVSSPYDHNHIRQVEQFLNERMSEVSRRSEIYSPSKLAVLVALNLADELIASKRGLESDKDHLEDAIRVLCDQLDEALSKYLHPRL